MVHLPWFVMAGGVAETEQELRSEYPADCLGERQSLARGEVRTADTGVVGILCKMLHSSAQPVLAQDSVVVSEGNNLTLRDGDASVALLARSD